MVCNLQIRSSPKNNACLFRDIQDAENLSTMRPWDTGKCNTHGLPIPKICCLTQTASSHPWYGAVILPGLLAVPCRPVSGASPLMLEQLQKNTWGPELKMQLINKREPDNESTEQCISAQMFLQCLLQHYKYKRRHCISSWVCLPTHN